MPMEAWRVFCENVFNYQLEKKNHHLSYNIHYLKKKNSLFVLQNCYIHRTNLFI